MKTTEDVIGLQFDTADNGINLSTKNFNRGVFKLLNKNLNFEAMQKYFIKNKFYNKINGFYRRIKFKQNTDEDKFRKEG